MLMFNNVQFAQTTWVTRNGSFIKSYIFGKMSNMVTAQFADQVLLMNNTFLDFNLLM